MEKKINITAELVSRFDGLGYPCKEESFDRMIMNCFITSNLEKVLGAHILDEEDVEIIRSQHYITVTSTFYPTPIVFEVNREDDKVTLCALNGHGGDEIFSIEKVGNKVTNRVHDRENFEEHEYEVENFQDSTFTYTKYQVDGENKEVMFKGQLRGLGAKYRDREVFELTRIVPPEYREVSLLKRIVDGIKGENYIYITTSDQMFETLVFTDVIFDRLEVEERKQRNNLEKGPVLTKK